jgi:hypothetical protein
LDQLAPLRRGKNAYLFAAASIAAAVAMTAAAQVVFEPLATLIFAAAVVVSTAIFGFAAGLVSAALGVLALDYFFIPPNFELNMDRATLRAAVELGVLAVCTHFVERHISGQIRSKKKAPLGIHGQLDGIADGEAYGWAMNCDDPSSPVLVTILVDHRPAAEVAAVYYRPDVESNLHSSGSYGFFADLSARVPAEKEAMVEAIVGNGQRLKNCPQQAVIPARVVERGPTVLFMHIPKTAGIAFREAIAANYRESQIAYLYGTAPGFLTGDLRRLPLEQRRDLRFIIGHFQYGLHDDLPQEALYITIVREPAARMLSQYAFVGQTQPALLRQGSRVLELEELLETKPHIHFDNALVRHFGGVDEREFPAGSVNHELYRKALYYVRTGFTFIGHQEFAAQAYSSLRQRFAWNARPELEVVNTGPARLDSTKRTQIRKAMEKYNPWDCELYEEILRIFPYPKY